MSLFHRLKCKSDSIRSNFKHWAHSSVLKLLDLEADLVGGVRVKCKSLSDWIIFSTIFGGGEYDDAIRRTFVVAPASGALNVIDVGANVGFFTLRFAQLAAESGGGRDFHITCIEGYPATARELGQRLESAPAVHNHYRLVTGLVGKRRGTACINPAPCHAMTSTFGHKPRSGVEVAYVDLDEIIPPDTTIDLLKCDIEGSEGELIQNYEGLLKRTRVAVFEFHHDKVSAADCRQRLESCGLRYVFTVRQDKFNSVELFQRPKINEIVSR